MPTPSRLGTGLVLLLVVGVTPRIPAQGVDALQIPSIRVFPGETSILHPVRSTNTEPMQGYQIAASYDSAVVDLQEVTLSGSFTAIFAPDFMTVNLDGSGPGSFFTLVVILETMAPFDGSTIPASSDRILVNLRYEIPVSVPVGSGSLIDLRDDLGNPPISNIFTVAGFSLLPILIDGTVTVVPPGTTFQRADANSDGITDLRDPIFMLEFLFRGGTRPSCPDAADFNDDGSINLFDPIATLRYLFTEGSPPSYPFPGFGLDPTDDVLGPCG